MCVCLMVTALNTNRVMAARAGLFRHGASERLDSEDTRLVDVSLLAASPTMSHPCNC